MMEQEQRAAAEQDEQPAAEDQGPPAVDEHPSHAVDAAFAEEVATPEPPTPAPATGLLTADEIYAADDLKFEDIPVGEWTPGWTEDGDVEPRCIRLLEMSADQAIEFTDSLQSDKKSRNKAMVNIIRLTAVDLAGNKLFGASGAMQAMMQKSSNVYQRLSVAALKLNGFTSDDDDDEESAEKKD